MDKEKVRRAIEVMEAYNRGEAIEVYSYKDKNWSVTTDPLFNWSSCDYRVKKKDTYRPFVNKEECWQEMLKHKPFGWLKSDYNYYSVSSIGKVCIWLDSGVCYTFEEIFNSSTFADGTPFGIKKD